MPAELDDSRSDTMDAMAEEQQQRESAEEKDESGQSQAAQSSRRASTTTSSNSNPRDHPQTPKFAPSRPVAVPDASPFPRPLSFPSESWPAPPLEMLQDPSKRGEVAAEMAKQPGGTPDRFARWIVSTTVAHYEGSYVNGLFDGHGTGVFKCGQRYTGQWSQGLMHGEGCLTLPDGCTYTGSMQHQSITGRGKFLWPDSATYDGEVLDGLRHGYGVFIDPSEPCMYEGQWVHGLRQGQGKLTYDNAGTHFYEGQWHEGARHGYGLLRYASGNLYEGEWVWDRKVGQGTMSWFSSNQKYTGSWLNDKPHGVGEYTWLNLPVAGLAGQAQTTSLTARGTSVTSSASGARGGPLLTHFQHHNRYVGDWVQGVREGSGTMFYSNGSLFQGGWHNDRKEGPGRFVFPNGSVISDEFRNDQMADSSKWNNPYSGVAEQMGALSLTNGAAQQQQPANGTAVIASPKSKKHLTPSATTVKDVGMFDLPLDDLLAAHIDELGLRSGAPATQAYVTSQKEQLANLLLRYNTELLDVYRFYAQAPVDLAQPGWEPAALPFTPLSPTSAPANLVHPSAQASSVSSRLNLAQLWLLISDLGVMGHPGLCTPDLSLAAIDRLVFRRMLLGRAPEAHANRLLLPDLNSIHDPRQILLVRDFNEALIRLADELFRMPVDSAAETAAAASDEERELAREEAELARQIEQEEAAASGTPLDDAASAEYVPPTVLYARAHQAFNQLLLGPNAAPAPSDLSLPLHAITALTSPTSDRSPGGSQRGAITMNASSALVATTTARGGYGSTIAFAGVAPAAAVAPRNTLVNRFKRFLVEFLLPRAQRRSKHAFSSHGGSQLASPGRGAALESGSFGGNALGLSLTQQPLYRLPMLVQLAKAYEKDIYTRIFLPYSTTQQHNLLLAAAGAVVPAAATATDPALKLLQPLSDRTIRLSAVLRLLQVRPPSPAPAVLNAYFTFYHCLDLLFGCQSHRDERLWEGMEVELLFEELVELLIKLALWRGKVLAQAAVSIGQERAQLERLRAERREKAEAEAKARADAAAAAQAEIDAAAAAAAAAAEPDSTKGGKPGAKAAAGAKSSAPSKPSSAAGSKEKAAAAAAAATKDGKSGSAAAARAGSAKKTSSGSATPAGGKASAAPTPRSTAGSGSGKKKEASKSGSSKPSSAKGSNKKKGSVSGVGAFASPLAASNALSPHASQPNSSRLQAALLGGSSGTLRKSHPSSSDVISEFDRLSLADAGNGSGSGIGGASFGGIECDTSGWAGDVEHFLCTLLQKPLPAAGVHTSFPTNLSEDGMQSVL